MAKSRLVRFAESWRPDPDDAYGEDKRRLIRYLLKNRITASNPRPIQSMLDLGILTRQYKKEAFQHQILGPLRRDPRVFIGTSNAGVFIVTSAADADATLGFYTWRVRAELRHARNLRQLAKRAKLMDGYTSAIPAKKDRATIYLDESGSPAELEAYLKRQNSGLPVSRLGAINFADSSQTRLVQLADLVAGAVRRSVAGDPHPLREIEDKMINLQFWPPR